MVRRVDGATRVDVLAPHTADRVRLFDNDMSNAEPLKAHGHCDAARSGTDNERIERLGPRLRRGDDGVAGDEAHLFLHHSQVLTRHLVPETHRHHSHHAIVVGNVDGRGQAPTRDGSVADLFGDFSRKAAGLVGDDADVLARQKGSGQPSFVAGDVMQRHEKHPQVRGFHGLPHAGDTNRRIPHERECTTRPRGG